MKSSLRLFKQDLELQLRSICNFSSRHKLQLFPPALIELARDKFEDIKHENDTELSKHVWKLKLDKKQFSIYWSILSRASSIKAGGNSCNLCLEEKLQILRNCISRSCLNKRSELFTKCVHARKFHAGRFKRTRVSKHTANSIM